MDYTLECRNIAKRDDPDRYLVSLFAPARAQAHLWALIAFNQEIAKIRETVSDPMLGEIRLQWWSDVLDEIKEGQVREHPVVQALAALIDKSPYIFPLLMDTLEARRDDILTGPTINIEAIDAYAARVGGSFQKALMVAWSGQPLDEHTEKLATDIGSAWSLIGLVRAVPYQWQSGDMQIAGENATQIMNAADAWDLLQPTLSIMLANAREKIAQALSLKSALPRNKRSLLLFASMLVLQSNKLRAEADNPFKLIDDAGTNAKTLLNLAFRAMTGKYD